MKKEYVSPQIDVEVLTADANFAMVCSNTVPSAEVACLEATQRNLYESLVYGWEVPPEASLGSLNDVIYSDDRTCYVSCYQGPFDSIFSS